MSGIPTLETSQIQSGSVAVRESRKDNSARKRRHRGQSVQSVLTPKNRDEIRTNFKSLPKPDMDKDSIDGVDLHLCVSPRTRRPLSTSIDHKSEDTIVRSRVEATLREPRRKRALSDRVSQSIVHGWASTSQKFLPNFGKPTTVTENPLPAQRNAKTTAKFLGEALGQLKVVGAGELLEPHVDDLTKAVIPTSAQETALRLTTKLSREIPHVLSMFSDVHEHANPFYEGLRELKTFSDALPSFCMLQVETAESPQHALEWFKLWRSTLNHCTAPQRADYLCDSIAALGRVEVLDKEIFRFLAARLNNRRPENRTFILRALHDHLTEINNDVDASPEAKKSLASKGIVFLLPFLGSEVVDTGGRPKDEPQPTAVLKQKKKPNPRQQMTRYLVQMGAAYIVGRDFSDVLYDAALKQDGPLKAYRLQAVALEQSAIEYILEQPNSRSRLNAFKFLSKLCMDLTNAGDVHHALALSNALTNQSVVRVFPKNAKRILEAEAWQAKHFALTNNKEVLRAENCRLPHSLPSMVIFDADSDFIVPSLGNLCEVLAYTCAAFRAEKKESKEVAYAMPRHRAIAKPSDLNTLATSARVKAPAKQAVSPDSFVNLLGAVAAVNRDWNAAISRCYSAEACPESRDPFVERVRKKWNGLRELTPGERKVANETWDEHIWNTSKNISDKPHEPIN